MAAAASTETNGASKGPVSDLAQDSTMSSVSLLEAAECEVTNRLLSRHRQPRCLSAARFSAWTRLMPRDLADRNGQENTETGELVPSLSRESFTLGRVA